MPKPVPKKWIRNKADELAIERGCYFDSARGKAVCDWIEEYLFLYEGRDAGNKFILIDWQRDCIMRIFGWMRYSEERGKAIRRFRWANIFVSKKCGKTPLLAAIGLYMLCGDREEGQKCFSVALDGKQAMLQQQHAIQMVLGSDILNQPEMCTINKSTGQIAYHPTNSFYRVVSGDNIQGQQGLNGSIFIDELHVVDARLMSVLEYAGRSRDEPLFFGVSTAGNNPDGYGKKQFDYGRMVNDGREDDIHFFHQEYMMPDDVTEKDLEENLDKYLKMANPSIGVTVYLEDLRADYEKSKRSIASFNDFKMYSLGQWQMSSSPWLKAAAWQQCVNPLLYIPRNLFLKEKGKRHRKLDAYAALDLSRVSDMCAFVLAIPRKSSDGKLSKIQLLIRLWLPERYALNHGHLAKFKHWADNGHLILTPGDTMDYTIVRRDIHKLCKHFNVLQCAYDEMFAEATMQELTEGYYDADGVEIESGIGWERIAFPQTTAGFAQATEDFEGIVLDNTLVHPNNPCLNWQAGHVEVKSDAFGNKRPIKPTGSEGEEREVKKIDAVVASIMACALVLRAEKNPYESVGLLAV